MKRLIRKIKNMSKKSKIILAIVLLLLLGLGIFGIYKLVSKDKLETKPKTKEKVVEPEKPAEPQVQIVDVNSKSRPFAVMINNINAARPLQSGLQDAYIVYEIIVEGGITRYMALFKDVDTERIGSVRSSRHYFLDYALENDAYYAHWGWSTQAQLDINSLKINNINGLVYEGKYFFRDKTLRVSSEHRGFTKMSMLKEAAQNLKYRAETNKDLLLKYSATEIDTSNLEGVIPANNVTIKYSNTITTSYTYDAENKVYKRFVNNQEHKDYVTGNQYTAKNIITYQVGNSTRSNDIKGRQNLNNIGSGNGYYITNGVAIPITWEKTSRESQTVYKFLNGEKITVNDGNTYIQIQPLNQPLTIN
ncbi:MAG: DUF3048 domain-containing protein [Bacilli bacterium]|nr:DUF3048 domain-containing protein [Bacilli bacterium]